MLDSYSPHGQMKDGRQPRCKPCKAEKALELYYLRRSVLIDYMGGECVLCHSTDELQMDHIDPESKAFNIASNIHRRWSVVVPEVDKCQLLCSAHHDDKTYGWSE